MLDTEQRDAETAYRAASRRAGWKAAWWGIATIALSLAIPLASPTIAGMIVMIVAATLATVMTAIAAAKWIAIVVTAHPSSIAPAFCPYCGFNLQRVDRELCPECGRRIPGGTPPATPREGDEPS